MTTTVSPSGVKIRKKTAAGCVVSPEVITIKLLIRNKSIVYGELSTPNPPFQPKNYRVIKNFHMSEFIKVIS